MDVHQVIVSACDNYEASALARAFEELEPVFAAQIRPGDNVVLKPNWLAAHHKYDPDEWLSVITHPAIITAALERVLACLKGKGTVTIADGPQTDSAWEGIMARMTPQRWIEMGEAVGVSVTVLDLRDHEWIREGPDAPITARRDLPGDPKGSVDCDLGSHSEFTGHEASRRGYYGADIASTETNEAHSGGRHKYRVSRTVIEADVFVNLPKMKTHKKAGITCNLKNLVGINTYKNWLPHHNQGTPDQGGDQFPTGSPKRRLEAAVLHRARQVAVAWPPAERVITALRSRVGTKVLGDTRDTIRSGNWYGNDTLWRMVLDLNKVLFYANADGSLRADEAAQRKRYVCVVDGVIAGQGNGPEAPTPLGAGVLIAGLNPVPVDAACARLMGLDWRRIPTLSQVFEMKKHGFFDAAYTDIVCVSSEPRFAGKLDDIESNYRFKPHFGWVGHVELASTG